MFSNYFLLLFVSQSVHLPLDLLQIHSILVFMLFFHSTFLLCSFCFHILLENILYYLDPGFHLFLSFLHRLVGRMFFHYFGRSFFACIASFFPNIFCVSLLMPVFFGKFLKVLLSILFAVVFFVVFLFYCVLANFSFFGDFVCSWSVFLCPSSLISKAAFVILFRFFMEMPILSLTSFAPT